MSSDAVLDRATPDNAPSGNHLSESEDSLTTLARSVYSSRALNNNFYDVWMSRPLSKEDLAIFARNYGEFNRSFPEVLAVMILHTKNIPARTEYAKTLFSEMGYGQEDKVHSVLFDAFFAELSERLGDPEYLKWENIEARLPVLPETVALIEGEKELYARDNATASGAQLALEWQAYTMLRQLYDGARNYQHLWEAPDEFHEACEYFYAHIGATEKEHKIESLNGARQFDLDAESRSRIEDGFHTHLDLFGDFWNAVAAEFTSTRTKGRRAS